MYVCIYIYIYAYIYIYIFNRGSRRRVRRLTQSSLLRGGRGRPDDDDNDSTNNIITTVPDTQYLIPNTQDHIPDIYYLTHA